MKVKVVISNSEDLSLTYTRQEFAELIRNDKDWTFEHLVDFLETGIVRLGLELYTIVED